MDFLKSCTTNLQAVDGYSTIECQIYAAPAPATVTPPTPAHAPVSAPAPSTATDGEQTQADSEMRENATRQSAAVWDEECQPVLAQLRSRGALVQSAVNHNKRYVFVFGGFAQAEEYLKQLRFSSPQKHTVQVADIVRPGLDRTAHYTNQTIYRRFLSAVEESLSIALASSCRAIRIAYLTWIVPIDTSGTEYDVMSVDGGPSTEYAQLSLRVQVTSLGTLVLSPDIVVTGLEPLASPSPAGRDDQPLSTESATPILLAPTGTPASVCDTFSTLSVNDETPNFKSASQLKREARARLARNEAWKSLVTRKLQYTSEVPSENIGSMQWSTVRFHRRPQGTAQSHDLPEPDVECLWPNSLCFTLATSVEPSIVATTTTIADWLRPDSYQDPLVAAEKWLLGLSDRDESAAGARETRRVEEDNQTTTESAPEPTPDQLSLASPVYFRGADSVNTNSIYPTPPEGLLAPPTTGAQSVPSSGTFDDPSTQNGPEDDAPVANPGNAASGDTQRSRKDSSDGLFGDADEEMFGAPDIDVTDADFNFFDDNDASGGKGSGVSMGSANPADNANTSPRKKTTEPVALEGDALPSDSQSNLQYSVKSPRAASTEMTIAKGTHEPSSVDRISPEPKSAAYTKGLGTGGRSEPEHDNEEGTAISTPPLSPFQIKERILPTPIPASSVRSQDESPVLRPRKDSNYNAVVFNREVMSFDAKYGSSGRFNKPRQHEADGYGIGTHGGRTTSRPNPAINLPRKSYGQSRGRCQAGSANRSAARDFAPGGLNTNPSDDTSSDGSESETSDTDSDEPTDTLETFNKRKRPLADDGGAVRSPRPLTDIQTDSDVESIRSVDDSALAKHQALLDLVLPKKMNKDSQGKMQLENQRRFRSEPSTWQSMATRKTKSAMAGFWDIFEFNEADLIEVAQLLANQSSELIEESGTYPVHTGSSMGLDSGATSAIGHVVAQSALKQVFADVTDLDFPKLAALVATHSEKATSGQNQPRPPPNARRPNGTPMGAQHLFTIPTPSVRVRRALAPWELLPTALTFWDALGLEPASGLKHVLAYVLYPDNGDTKHAATGFLDDISLAYESCKLGEHVRGPNTHPSSQPGLVPYAVADGPSIQTAMYNMYTACVRFGEMLRDAEFSDDNNAIVVYFVNPFPDPAMHKYMCACFWTMYNIYADRVEADDDPLQELILQIVPIQRVAPRTTPVVPETAWLAALARQVYDQIPCQDSSNAKAVWRIPSGPSIQLASPLTRKINFAINERPPKSLLEEAQIMHVSYAVSPDNAWLSAAWTDVTGKYQFCATYCLTGVDGLNVLTELRDTTLSMTKSVTWRIFVARVGTMMEWEKRVWKEKPSDNWTISLLDVDVNPTVQFSSAAQPIPQAPAPGFVTPASTPQPNSMTVSPDTYGAPGTPAPSEQDTPATSNPTDPDSYLVDSTDETWGIILPFSAAHCPYELKRSLASSVLLKRGSAESRNLPSLAVDLVDVLPPKMSEGQAVWLMARSPDMILREVLSWYRGLGLLARLRGLDKTGVVPWHVGVAVKGAEALQGFLD